MHMLSKGENNWIYFKRMRVCVCMFVWILLYVKESECARVYVFDPFFFIKERESECARVCVYKEKINVYVNKERESECACEKHNAFLQRCMHVYI